MSITAATAGSRPHAGVGARDRMFYSGMALAMAITVFAGFAPSYYLRAVFGAAVTPTGATTITPLVHLHGLLFTGWVLLFIVQTALVAQHRTRVHQRLGIAGGFLAAAMVVVGTATGITAAARDSAPPGIDPLSFLIVPLTDVVLFAGFVGTALWKRRDREAHKRLMMLAYISIIVAAVARLPGVLAYGPPAFFGLTCILLFASMAYDYVSRRRVHPVYLWGGALFIVSVPARLMLSTTEAWLGLARVLTQ